MDIATVTLLISIGTVIVLSIAWLIAHFLAQPGTEVSLAGVIKYQKRENQLADRYAGKELNPQLIDLGQQLRAKWPEDPLRAVMSYMASDLTSSEIDHYEFASAAACTSHTAQAHIQSMVSLGYLEKGRIGKTQSWKLTPYAIEELTRIGDIQDMN